MRRVVPSEVVRFIDAVLPGAAKQENEKTNLEYDLSYTGQLSTLLTLAQQVPEHLITLTDADYFIYIAALGAIREIIPEWQARGGARTLKKVPNVGNGLNPVTLVRVALLKCPDDLRRRAINSRSSRMRRSKQAFRKTSASSKGPSQITSGKRRP